MHASDCNSPGLASYNQSRYLTDCKIQIILRSIEITVSAQHPASEFGATVINYFDLRRSAFAPQPLPDEWPEWGRKAVFAKARRDGRFR